MKWRNRAVTLILCGLVVVFVGLICLDRYLKSRPTHWLAGRRSQANAEMGDAERKLSELIRDGGDLPFEFMGDTPFLREIPITTGNWIRSGNGNPGDPFQKGGRYWIARLRSGNWFLIGFGPDRDQDITMAQVQQWDFFMGSDLLKELAQFQYNPTNGAISNGDMWRLGGEPFDEE